MTKPLEEVLNDSDPIPWKTGTKKRGRFSVYSERHGKGVCKMQNTQTTTDYEVKKYGEHGCNLAADANASLIAHAVTCLPGLVSEAKLLLTEIERHHKMNVKKDFSFMVAVESMRRSVRKAQEVEFSQ